MIRKCLFPVAGYGSRFLPATKSMPKAMLPIVNKPLVQYGVEEALAAGMSHCALVTGRGKRARLNFHIFAIEVVKIHYVNIRLNQAFRWRGRHLAVDFIVVLLCARGCRDGE